MRNIMDYLATEFATFDEVPFCAVDALVLSEFCMVRMECILPAMKEESTIGGRAAARLKALLPGKRGVCFKDALMAEHFSDMFTGLVPEKIKELMFALAASPRFRDMRMEECASVFDEGACTQFAALSFSYRNEFAFVGFRGTDCSFTGWREDFDMAYMDLVPAQESAVRYLDAAAPRLPKRLFVGGHSKGGNLATYAALRCSDAVRARIAAVFDHDGPGFKPGFLEDEAALRARAQLEGRLQRTVPMDSVVGMLMDAVAPETAVLSSAVGIDQHSVFTWEIEDGAFVGSPQVGAAARRTHEVMGEWLASFKSDELPGFIDALFRALESSGASNAGQIFGGGPQAAQLIREATRNADDEAREVIGPAIGRLAAISAAGIARDAAAGIKDGLSALFQRPRQG